MVLILAKWQSRKTPHYTQMDLKSHHRIYRRIEVPRVIYSKAKMQDILIEEGRAQRKHSNIRFKCEHMGEGTPIYANDLSGTTKKKSNTYLTCMQEVMVETTLPRGLYPPRTPTTSESDQQRFPREEETLKDNPTENNRSSSDEDIRS